jgi:hypothetical protein
MGKRPYTEEELLQLLTLLSNHRFYLNGRAVEVSVGRRDAYNVQRVSIETERDGVEIGFPVEYGEKG